MATVSMSKKFNELVAADAHVEKIATGFLFTEGPIWHPTGHYLLFSDIPGDARPRWDENNGIQVVKRPSNKCNGMTYDANLNLIVCEHSTSSVTRERPEGTREVIASHYEGKELNSPNDVVVASDGSIYFSDPTYGRMPWFGIERKPELGFQGMYRVPPGGGLQLLVDDFGEPNGLCFSPDESLLYVNDTPRAHIRVFDVGPDRTVANGRIFAQNIGTGELARGGLVDGMKCDERGNVYVTGPGGIWIFSPAAEHLGIIEVPESVANLNWGGPDWKTLWIAASTSIYRMRTKIGGNRVSYMMS